MNTKIDEQAERDFCQSWAKENRHPNFTQDIWLAAVRSYASRHAQAETVNTWGTKITWDEKGVRYVNEIPDTQPTQPTASVPAVENQNDEARWREDFSQKLMNDDDAVAGVIWSKSGFPEVIHRGKESEPAVSEWVWYRTGRIAQAAIPPSQPQPDEPVRGVPEGWQPRFFGDSGIPYPSELQIEPPTFVEYCQQAIRWLEAKYQRHKELEDKDAADLIRMLAAAPTPAVSEPDRVKVTDEMVNRFLCWKLPTDFSPDAGIRFQPEYNVEWMAKQGKPPCRHEPVGTNLLNADQARAMLEHVLAVPKPASEPDRVEVLPPLDDELVEILGRPCFACISLAQVLRLGGDDIPHKAEREQAAVAYWLLGLYFKSPQTWRDDADAEIKSIQARHRLSGDAS